MTGSPGPREPQHDASRADDREWKREHAVDYADFLDALLDPDDPLHEVAKRAVQGDDAVGD